MTTADNSRNVPTDTTDNIRRQVSIILPNPDTTDPDYIIDDLATNKPQHAQETGAIDTECAGGEIKQNKIDSSVKTDDNTQENVHTADNIHTDENETEQDRTDVNERTRREGDHTPHLAEDEAASDNKVIDTNSQKGHAKAGSSRKNNSSEKHKQAGNVNNRKGKSIPPKKCTRKRTPSKTTDVNKKKKKPIEKQSDETHTSAGENEHVHAASDTSPHSEPDDDMDEVSTHCCFHTKICLLSCPDILHAALYTRYHCPPLEILCQCSGFSN